VLEEYQFKVPASFISIGRNIYRKAGKQIKD